MLPARLYIVFGERSTGFSSARGVVVYWEYRDSSLRVEWGDGNELLLSVYAE